MSHPGAAFLDRDGTINVKAKDGEYVERPEEVVLLTGAAKAIRRLNDSGLRVIVITNQRGIALGRFTHRDLEHIHSRLAELVTRQSGGHIDAFFYCPHEIGTCLCRKPDVGLFLQAKERWPEIDFAASAMIGDSIADIAAGRALGMASIQLGVDANDLLSAVHHLLGDDVRKDRTPSS